MLQYFSIEILILWEGKSWTWSKCMNVNRKTDCKCNFNCHIRKYQHYSHGLTTRFSLSSLAESLQSWLLGGNPVNINQMIRKCPCTQNLFYPADGNNRFFWITGNHPHSVVTLMIKILEEKNILFHFFGRPWRIIASKTYSA
jgi:hypothetical protein